MKTESLKVVADISKKDSAKLDLENQLKRLDKVPKQYDSFSRDGINASIFYDIRRLKKDFKYPVKYRINYNRKQFYHPCTDLTIDQWIDLVNESKKTDSVKLRKEIKEGFKKITDIINELAEKEGFTVEGLSKRLSRGTTDSVLDAFDYKIEQLREGDHIGSSVWYSCAATSIKDFAKKDLKFSEITPGWLKKYEDHLLTPYVVKKKKKTDEDEEKQRTYTTVSMYMRALRAIINDAKANGIISQAQYPFVTNNNGKYQIPEGKGRKLALTSEQIGRVFDFEMFPEDEKWRDLWIFSFYCNGINMNDLLRLKYKDIEDGEISWFRQKTITKNKEKIKIIALITEEMQQIIDKQKSSKAPGNYIFPYLKDGLSAIDQRKIVQDVTHTINKKMRKIGKALGYGDITTYAARHSFATILMTGGAYVAEISKSMGHKNLKTTEIYLGSFGKDSRIKNAGLLPKMNKI